MAHPFWLKATGELKAGLKSEKALGLCAKSATCSQVVAIAELPVGGGEMRETATTMLER